jgi:hypothetical protein
LRKDFVGAGELVITADFLYIATGKRTATPRSKLLPRLFVRRLKVLFLHSGLAADFGRGYNFLREGTGLIY